MRGPAGHLYLHQLSPVQYDSLLALAPHGDQAIVKVSQVMANGQRLGSGDCGVWLRLVAMGLVEGSHGYLRLTRYGEEICARDRLERR